MISAAEIEALVTVRQLARSGRARELREAAGLSIGEIAPMIGVTSTTIWRWELGQRKPKGEAALRYAAFLLALQTRAPALAGISGARDEDQHEKV
jgi:DNA-binding transcriptional regulator YiaG